MKLEYLSQNRLEQLIKNMLAKHLSLGDYKVFFFGSRVRGNNWIRSDIDLGIEGKRPLPLKIKSAIEEEIENLPVLYKMDLVDFKSVSPSFIKNAKQWVEYVQ